jgi:ABC-type nitrate/sulfonate/bicarbonate transport system substrate-binding protein
MSTVATESVKKICKFVYFSAAVWALALNHSAANATETIRVGTLPITTQLPLFTAMDKGYFKEAGLDVQVQTFVAGAPLLQALNVGAVDVAGAVNIGTFLEAESQGFDDVVIAGDAGTGTDIHSGITLLEVRKDSGINDLKDLAGKRIGLPNLRSLNWAYHLEYLNRNGVNTSTIHWIEVGTPGAPAAVLTRQVDAADMVEPFATVGLQSGEAKGLYNCFAAIAPGGLISVQLTQRKWATANADTVRRFVTALKRAFDYNEAHQQEARERLTKHTKINEALANKISWPISKLSVEPKDLQIPMDLSVKYGLLKKAIPVDNFLFATATAH